MNHNKMQMPIIDGAFLCNIQMLDVGTPPPVDSTLRDYATLFPPMVYVGETVRLSAACSEGSGGRIEVTLLKEATPVGEVNTYAMEANGTYSTDLEFPDEVGGYQVQVVFSSGAKVTLPFTAVENEED